MNWFLNLNIGKFYYVLYIKYCFVQYTTRLATLHSTSFFFCQELLFKELLFKRKIKRAQITKIQNKKLNKDLEAAKKL